MNKQEIPFLSATELAGLIRSREVSPVEATEAYLERIAQVDGKLNSYITVCSDEALAAARQAEQEIGSGNYCGPMHGIPVAVKDQLNSQGIRTTGGSSILADNVPDEDATAIARLKEAGSVLLGKLNMSEFASGDAFHHPYGRPRNPWDLDRNPGTSSSGSGAATAAFLCATSLGEDTGGSIRGPATFCGLVGIRPTWGRVSRYGMQAAAWSMDTAGPISRTVSDCAMTLEAIAGHDPKDPYTWDTPVPNYQANLSDDIRGLKVGVVKERVYTDVVDSEVGESVIRAIARLGELGADIEEVSLPMMVHSAAVSSLIIMVDAASLHREGLATHLDQYDYNNRIRLLAGSIVPAQAYQRALKARQALRQEILDALNQVDVLVMPTSSIPASLIPDRAGINSKQEVLDGYAGRRSFTSPFNLASVPALSVPCGFTGSNLPIGLQIAGRPFDEQTVFNTAYAYEQSNDWYKMHPDI
ncbi:Glutamyl-tRNA(Gln) amidotransferase subunit A [Geodia barretti]|uniref:Glutamyl-tRNA(Gln) amidotransferase subunit A n=2 Tax=Geodia barretti TaxID=519541 RepID=A0AA35XET0_GEOBA|nr:Glutamyl-tRNA(Gln) amidotransferase subunit A [Geodia barretti]